MPLTPLNNDFLQCPICFNCFTLERRPVTLLCSHTCCSSCLISLQNCPFDQTEINAQLPENESILSLLPCLGNKDLSQQNHILSECLAASASANHAKLMNVFSLTTEEALHYRKSVDCIKSLAQLLKPSSSAGCALSRPMQRKLVTLLHCQLVEGDGRLRAVKNARSIGERALSELLIKHQDPYTLSANLWAAVRSRGCQFLGPAMQEEILKLVLLALEDKSHLSRKVLVMFVVQRLSPHFPHQASKTAIGHVIQLLYRASCFRLTKRDGDSSLMQLKEEYCSYEALRREHDTQIVSIALESGLKISPDQWSSLLYGDTLHKSHMQSIIDKLQSPASFNQSIQELVIALQRTQDPAGLGTLKEHFERLAKIDPNANGDETEDPPLYPTHDELAIILDSCKLATFRLIDFCKQHSTLFAPNGRYANGRSSNYTAQNPKFKNPRGSIPNGTSGTNSIIINNKPSFQSNNVRPLTANGTEKPTLPSPRNLLSSFESLSPSLPVPPSTPIGQFQALDTNSAIQKLRAELKHKPCAYVPPTVQQQQQQQNLKQHFSTNVTSNNNTSTCNGNGYTNGYSKVSTSVNSTNGPTQTSPKHQINGFKPTNNGSTNGTARVITSSIVNAQSNFASFISQPLQRSLQQQSQQIRSTQFLKQMQQQQQQFRDNQNSLQSIQNSLNALNTINSLNNLNTLNNLNVLTSQVNLNNLHIPTQTSNSNSATTNSSTMPIPIATKQLYGQLVAKSLQPGSRIGSFEDDQFIPFADQPFVSKFGPISRECPVNAMDTSTITGSMAKAQAPPEGGISDGQTQLTNVVLNRTSLPSLTLIEPMQQLSSVFADLQFL